MTKKRAERKSAHQPERARRLWQGSAPIVVLPLDGSTEAKAALPLARLMARLMGATVNVVHATEETLPQEKLLERVKLERHETRGLIVDRVSGPPAGAILRLAEEKRAALIVITTRGRTAYLGHTVRPVVEQIVREAPYPVLLVRPEIYERVASMHEIRRILLPLDGAPSSAAEIGPAMVLARLCGAEVDVLYVATQAERPLEPGTLTVPRYIDQPHHEWPSWAREFISRFCALTEADEAHVPTRACLRRGDPATEILRFAGEHESDLIVLEWRGQLDPDHARVVKAVVSQAPCPVLLLRAVVEGSGR